jgi:hypothetical protein
MKLGVVAEYAQRNLALSSSLLNKTQRNCHVCTCRRNEIEHTRQVCGMNSLAYFQPQLNKSLNI